ncbi:hypothetical protein C8J57DRAFT_1237406 [Mycena rebaudengoi]|nr:hypothetical protein C8J57DRAFT_1237406 [Mycena rebaudengoi]
MQRFIVATPCINWIQVENSPSHMWAFVLKDTADTVRVDKVVSNLEAKYDHESQLQRWDSDSFESLPDSYAWPRIGPFDTECGLYYFSPQQVSFWDVVSRLCISSQVYDQTRIPFVSVIEFDRAQILELYLDAESLSALNLIFETDPEAAATYTSIERDRMRRKWVKRKLGLDESRFSNWWFGNLTGGWNAKKVCVGRIPPLVSDFPKGLNFVVPRFGLCAEHASSRDSTLDVRWERKGSESVSEEQKKENF